MQVESVSAEWAGGYPVLRMVIDGHPAHVFVPKYTLLSAGIVVLLDDDGYWSNTVSSIYQADENPVRLPGATDDEEIVAVVRDWLIDMGEGYFVRCTFTFEDGATLTASAFAAVAGEEVPTRWDGAVDRIPGLRRSAPADDLPMLCRRLAQRHGAEVMIETQGKFAVD